MRWLLPFAVLAAAAAGCDSSKSTSNDLSSTGPDMATSSCSQTVDDYCAAGNCVRDENAAQQKQSWCPGGTATGAVTLEHCAGSETVVVVQYSDSANSYVYAGGMLVAVFSSVPHSQDVVCLAGPARFAAPAGCDTPTTLCAGP